MQGQTATSNPHETPHPIYVDLDGTLIAGDVLWESVALLLRRQPLAAFLLPVWLLLKGRAGLKRQIAERVAPDPALLPYRPQVVAMLRAARQQGRRIVLSTASDRQVAVSIADHLGIFDEVIGSDGHTNLSSTAKLSAIEERSPDGFEYCGNSAADIPIWRKAAKAVLVAPTRAATRAATRLSVPIETLPGTGSPWLAALRAIRPHQWLKNAVLFVPLLLAHELRDVQKLLDVSLAFASFCALASATYLINDLLDIEADRSHPTKRKRPFAAGSLSIPAGGALCVGLLVGGFGASGLLLSAASTGMLALYLALTTAYSFYFKERLVLDVLMLAGLYTHRVLAGAVAAEVRVSPWLLAFSMFFFLSLALVKRYVELRSAETRGLETLRSRSYEVGDLGLVQSMGLTSGYLSVLVLCLFVSSDDVRLLYSTPELLWGITLIMLYWITRVWFLARRGQVPDDPVLFAARDRVSYACGLCLFAVVGLAAW